MPFKKRPFKWLESLKDAIIFLIFFCVNHPCSNLFAHSISIPVERSLPLVSADSLIERKRVNSFEDDSLQVLSDSSRFVIANQIVSERQDTASRMEPWQVVLWSIPFPGFGQFYNESYWKIPIVYGGLGAMMYLALTNNTLYLDYRERYINSLATNDPLAESNRRLRDFYRTNRDQYYIFFVAAYALALLDAYIDAHFFGFETSDNLSIRIAPQFGPNQNELIPSIPQGASVGIQIGF
ncbi:MAG: DUF5683 domain-containing protein [Chloroherpetonaceae bacterium]|nr:DUF5683 domain-containing protein [Chloroherpetonaceae bacterium]